MRRLGSIFGALALTLACAPAYADVVSPAPDSVSATLYRDPFRAPGMMPARDGATPGGLVLISEERTVDLPAGLSRVSFVDVADTIAPQTASLDGLVGRVVEQNFDYDLLTPATLAAKTVGAKVRLITTNPATGQETERRGVLRASAQGAVIDFDGELQALHCSGLPERLVFDGVPTGLSDRPVLSMVVNSPTAGRRRLRLSYLATGFDWQASYVAHIRPDGRTLDLTGWITIANGSGATLRDAPVQLVAGRLNRVSNFHDAPRWIPPMPASPQCWPIVQVPEELVVTGRRLLAGFDGGVAEAPAPPPPPAPAMAEVKARDLGDYKLYSLPFSTTLAPRQTKQVAFLDRRGVGFERVYRYDVAAWRFSNGNPPQGDEPASVVLRLRNDKASKLGVPLPAGLADVQEEGGRFGPVFAGEDAVDDAPVGQEFELTVARAQDVPVSASQQVPRDIAYDGVRSRRRFRVVVSNAKPNPITLEVRHRVEDPREAIVEEPQAHGLRNGLPTWTLHLKPGERRVLEYETGIDDRPPEARRRGRPVPRKPVRVAVLGAASNRTR